MTDERVQNERRLSNLEVEMKTCDRRFREIKDEIKDLGKVYDIIYNLTTNMTAITEEMKYINTDIKDIKTDLRHLTRAPAEEGIYFKRLIIGAVILAAISFVMGSILI